MQTLSIQVIRIRYNALFGLAWLAFWAFLAFFMGVVMEWWTLESTTAHLWWLASAVAITFRRPFKTITVHSITLPIEKKRPSPMTVPIRLRPGSGMESYIHGSENAKSPTAQMWTDACYKKGAMGLGIVFLPDGAEKPTTWMVRCKEKGHDSTQAELHAINFAVHQALSCGHTNIVLHTDASMAIWHASRNTPSYDVMPALRNALDTMDCVQLRWVARERNEMANALSRMALSLPYPYAARLAMQHSPPERLNDWAPNL